MTATRWWVKAAARWLARIDGVKGQIQMLSLAVTAFSTFGILLQNFGLGQYVPYLGAAGFGGGVVYTYLYTEGGVWNQVSKDRNDLSADFAGPGSYIASQIQTQAFAAAIAAAENGEDPREAAKEAVEREWQGYRDGMPEDLKS